MHYETLLLDVREDIATLTLNRPQRLNAFNRTLLAELHAALRAVIELGSVRALVLTGAGRAFCSGADLMARATDMNPQDPDQLMRDFYNPAFALLRELKMPTVAAINGPCVGAGMSLALSCDIVLAARSAYFLQAFVNIGLVPDMGSTWLLPHRIGDARARALMLLGEKLPAPRAEEWGLIYRAVDDAALADEARQIARRFATGPTQAYLLIRQLGREAWKNDLAAQSELERQLQATARDTQDAKEALKAFAEKRPPKFEGR